MSLKIVWHLRAAAPLILVVCSGTASAGMVLERAEELYRHTRYTAASDVLLASVPESAAANALIGQSYFMEGQYKSATVYLEKAVAGEAANSDYYDWLGKAYGRRAEQSTFVTALRWQLRRASLSRRQWP